MEKWYPAWCCHMQNFSPLAADIKDLTQIVTFKSSAGGEKIHLLLSNKNGREPLSVSGIRLRTPESFCRLSIAGKDSVTLAPEEELFTDPAYFSLTPGQELTVEMTFPGHCLASGCAAFNSREIARVSFLDSSGGNKEAASFSPAVSRGFNRLVCFGLRSAELCGQSSQAVISVFGDSLVQQGYWYGALHQLLTDRLPGCTLCNEGIPGNRVLLDNHSSSSLNPLFGEAGVKRFEKDVYGLYRPEVVLIALGINDLVHPGNGCPQSELPTDRELIGGLRKLRDTALKNGSYPLLATLSPFCNYDGIWDPAREEIRRSVNQWIREQGPCLDIASSVQEAKDPSRLCQAFDCGDHLHLNESGGNAAARMIFPVLQQTIRKLVNL